MLTPDAAPGTVLVLEDEPGVRLLQQRSLERAGFKVAAAGDIAEARRLLEIFQPDLLVLDYQLGDGATGLDFYRALQSEGRDLPAILVTGLSDETRLLEAMRAGVRDFIPKTPNFADLTAPTVSKVMKQVLQERKLAAAEAAGRAKDNFLATLSHELRTPLTPVLAIVSELRGDAQLPAEVRADLEIVHRNITLEARLIDDLLDLTRIVRGKLELQHRPVNLRTIIEDALITVGSAGTSVRATTEISLGALTHPVLGDAARLTQVFWNLLSNAMKFTPAGGTVRVRASEEQDGAQRWARVEVEDSGIGIEPEVLAVIFEAFEQGERSITRHFGGLGLGLAISRPIVESHGGTLTAASAGRGRGSVFTVRLPLAEVSAADSGDPEDPRTSSPRLASTGAAILLVEDHDDSARLLARLLKRAGHRVTRAGSIAAARTALAEAERADEAPRGEARHFDLVISDVGLPDGTGFELMSEIRTRFALPGIALSGFGMEEDVRRALQAGFTRHLTKPVEIEDVLAAIRDVLGAAAE